MEENFCDRLRKAADLVGGQAELSRRTGISSRSISSYTAGVSDPSRERTVTIARAADVFLLWLATGEGPMRPGQEENREKTTKGIENHGEIRIAEKLTKTAEVLESDTIYRTALAANIDAFYHAVNQEQVILDQQRRMANLEARMASLEKQLTSASVTPDDHHTQSKDNAA